MVLKTRSLLESERFQLVSLTCKLSISKNDPQVDLSVDEIGLEAFTLRLRWNEAERLQPIHRHQSLR